VLLIAKVFFSSVEGRNEQTANRAAIIAQQLIQFRDKISFPLRVLRFMQISADGRAGMQKLICSNRFFIFLFDFSAQENNLFCKFFGFITKNALRHAFHLVYNIAKQKSNFKCYPSLRSE